MILTAYGTVLTVEACDRQHSSRPLRQSWGRLYESQRSRRDMHYHRTWLGERLFLFVGLPAFRGGGSHLLMAPSVPV